MSGLLDQAIKAARELPEAEQDAAGAALLDHLAAMRDSHLSDEQLAEVQRRLDDPSPRYVTLAEARELLRRT